MMWLLVRGALYVAVAVVLSQYYWPEPAPPDGGSGDGVLYEIDEFMSAGAIAIMTGAAVALGELAAHLHGDHDGRRGGARRARRPPPP